MFYHRHHDLVNHYTQVMEATVEHIRGN
jgi:hypothetical protein